ncbi:MAG TPA: DUF4118 domain-containing protein [Nocardioidaceae bacterium]|nr:DUF4118 domain-containing protein [Nocardioidaceae bacterium]
MRWSLRGSHPAKDVPAPLPRDTGGLTRSRRGVGLLLCLVGIPALTGALLAARGQLRLDGILLIYLLAVVVVAVVGGLWAALLAAVGSFLLANWFMTTPYYTFQVRGSDQLIELVVFVVTAILVSITVDVGARNRVSAERHRIEAVVLSRLTSSEVGAARPETVLEQLRNLFGLVGAELIGVAADEPPSVSVGDCTGQLAMTVHTDSGLTLRGYGTETFAHDSRLLTSMAETAARALQEQRLAHEAARAEQLVETDKMRSALLAAVSHDLRTPLAGIKASVSCLRQEDVSWSPEETAELLASIEDATDRLTELISNLLALSRIQAGAVSVHLAPLALDEVLGRALLNTDTTNLDIDVPEDLPVVLTDAVLLERIIANLLANAGRFSPPHEPVTVRAKPDGDGRVRVEVIDHGPGVPHEQWEDMFLPFQRLGDREARSGVGIGLAIARGFSDAMSATLTPAETPGGGLTMRLTLPVAR